MKEYVCPCQKTEKDECVPSGRMYPFTTLIKKWKKHNFLVLIVEKSRYQKIQNKITKVTFVLCFYIILLRFDWDLHSYLRF